MSNIFLRIVRAAILRYNRYVAMPFKRRRFQDLDILDSFKSIQYILDHHCSVSRFGDGEFFVIMGKGNGFQEKDEKMAQALKHVLENTDAPNHLIGVPYYLKSTRGCVQVTKDFWGWYVMNFGDIVRSMLHKDRTYIDTQLSRFWIEWKDKDRCRRQLDMLKKIWDGQNVIIVEGTKSRTGVGNDLYNNAKSVRRILGPAKSAYSQYDKILESITKYATKDNLILLSLGQTATVLAYDLAKLGYWAIDIGHLDIEYEWMKLGCVSEGVAVPGKFTNEAEAEGGHNVSDCTDKTYQQQIICDITKE